MINKLILNSIDSLTLILLTLNVTLILVNLTVNAIKKARLIVAGIIRLNIYMSRLSFILYLIYNFIKIQIKILQLFHI